MAEISTQSGSVSFGGLSSNLDTHKIVDAMVEAQRQPMVKIEKQQQLLGAHEALLQAIGERLSALSGTARQMESATRLLTPRADSSDVGVVSASAGEGARPGSHSIRVEALATAERVLSEPVAQSHAAGLLTPGVVRWRCNEAWHEVAIDAQTSLSQLAAGINRERGGLSANVLFDGEAYRLSLRGQAVGQTAALALSDTTNLGLDKPQNQLQPAQDAKFVLDDAIAMTRPTNTIDDAIEGVIVRLVAPGERSLIQVGHDPQQLLERIETFVTQYNDVRDAVDAATRPTQTLEKDRLVGDSSLRNLQDALQKVVTASVSSQAAGGLSLGTVGITSDKEGRLHIDAPRLLRSIEQDADAVARIFCRDLRQSNKGLAATTQKVCDQYNGATTGVIPAKLKSMQQQRARHDSRLAQMQTGLDRFEQSQRKKFSELERTMTTMKSQNEKLQAQLKSLQNKN